MNYLLNKLVRSIYWSGIAASCALTSHAQESRDNKSWEIRGTLQPGVISHDDEVFLADFGKPIFIKPPMSLLLAEEKGQRIASGQEISERLIQGESEINAWSTALQAPIYSLPAQNQIDFILRSIVDNVCGKVRNDNRTQPFLYQKAKTLFDKDRPQNALIEIPFCLKVTPSVPKTIKYGENISDLINFDMFGPPTNHYERFYDANTTLIEELVLKDANLNCAEALSKAAKVICVRPPAGQAFILPEKSEVRIFNIRSSIKETRFWNALRQRSNAIRVQLKMNRALSPLRLSNTPGTDDPSCGNTSKDKSIYPYVVEGVWKSYKREKNKAPYKLYSTKVGIIDSGVMGSQPGKSGSYFPHSLLQKYQKENSIIFSFGFDIYFKNRTWPISFSQSPKPSDVERNHGTSVANLIFGGSEFREKIIGEPQSPITLSIYNVAPDIKYRDIIKGHPIIRDAIEFFNKIQATGENGDSNFSSSLKYGLHVINMSFERDSSRNSVVDSIIDSIETNKGTIFVVAAGNGRKALDGNNIGIDLDVDELTVYPAYLAGEQDHVIAVAAITSDNKPAGFSNFGESSIDIAAPGCNIWTISAPDEAQGKVLDQRKSGTSFSAPLVTFATSLAVHLRSEKELVARAFKDRLGYTAKYLPHLSGYSNLGATLDITKMISIRTDVLETNTGLYFGNHSDFGANNEYALNEKFKTSELVSALRNMCPSLVSKAASKRARRFILRSQMKNDKKTFRLEMYHRQKRGFVSSHKCEVDLDDDRLIQFKTENGSIVKLSDHSFFDVLLAEGCGSKLLSREERKGMGCKI